MVANLRNECSFRVLLFLKEIPDDILKCMRVAYPWDTTEYTPTLIGVPLHVILKSEMEIIRRNFDDLRGTNKMLKERGVGGK